MPLVFLLFLLLSCTHNLDNPELLSISSKNQCIKEIVQKFVKKNSCDQLTQNIKSQLALRMTNCLFIQMGKSQLSCSSIELCNLSGDSWSTFTTFFTHIDNLCHFYWQLSKSSRTESLLLSLSESLSQTSETLNQNTETTAQILKLQSVLKMQMISSMATQQQMQQILSTSSSTLNGLTEQLSLSLKKIHKDIEQNYAIVGRVLSSIDQLLHKLDAIGYFLVQEVGGVGAVVFFLALVIMLVIAGVFMERVKIRRYECFCVLSVNFIIEFTLQPFLKAFIDLRWLRIAVIFILLVLVLSANCQKNKVQTSLEIYLNSQRMKRIMQRAIRQQQMSCILSKSRQKERQKKQRESIIRQK